MLPSTDLPTQFQSLPLVGHMSRHVPSSRKHLVSRVRRHSRSAMRYSLLALFHNWGWGCNRFGGRRRNKFRRGFLLDSFKEFQQWCVVHLLLDAHRVAASALSCFPPQGHVVIDLQLHGLGRAQVNQASEFQGLRYAINRRWI